MRRILFAGLALLLAVAAPFARAQPPPAAGSAPRAAESQAPVVDLETVVVSGAQPGPGLWKVSKGDHVLWILGTLSPLPRRMKWQSAKVERTIAASQAVLEAPGVKLETGVGLFRGLFLLPSLLKARKNPDGKRLQDVVPAQQYARWQALKARYIGSDRGIEQWRPVFAALELYDKAIRKSGMTHDNLVEPVVRSTARKHRIRIVSPELKLKIDNPKAAIKEFSAQALDDSACFAKTLDRIEGDLGAMAARANAWAVGDVPALRDLPAHNQFTACTAAFTGSELARKQGITNLPRRLRQLWLESAESALDGNASTFATLPVSLMLAQDGYLDALRAKGYVVQGPDETTQQSAAEQ
ncbi:TraB/GumN family protein [Luteimonas aquatica]|uniref:TraB/GumN family protein n=1 Tax=Luteimonas aquatica TaxID=450364 RepID=UPI001F582CFC|nr:TraB/GumN family protein [Luteimonas aquatica]